MEGRRKGKAKRGRKERWRRRGGRKGEEERRKKRRGLLEGRRKALGGGEIEAFRADLSFRTSY